MNLAMRFRDALMSTRQGNAIIDELDNIVASVRASWNVQHKADDTHGDVTADSLVVAGTVRGGSTGVFVGSVTAGTGYYERGRAALMGEWTAYTPAWTSTGSAPALGNGTIAGRYAIVGKTVFFEIDLTVGSTSTFGTGSWLFSLPNTKRADNWQVLGNGQWYALDSSSGNQYTGMSIANTTQVEPVTTAGTTALASGFTSLVPFTWATSDVVRLAGFYEMA